MDEPVRDMLAAAKLTELRAWLVEYQARWADARGGGGRGYRDGALDFVTLALAKLDAPLGPTPQIDPPNSGAHGRPTDPHVDAGVTDMALLRFPGNR